MAEIPLPFVYSHEAAFFALPFAERPPHIWECLLFFDAQRKSGKYDVASIDTATAVVRQLAQEVAVATSRALILEGVWKNQFDPRWPRYHPNPKNPLYLTGCYPPLLLCLPEDDTAWDRADFDDGQREFADWLLTPAGLHGIGDEQRADIMKMTDDWDEVVSKVRESEAEVKRLKAKVEASRAELDRLIGR